MQPKPHDVNRQSHPHPGAATLKKPIELHIASGEQNSPSLETLLNTDLLGKRIGTGDLRRGSDYLPEELVAMGDLPGAVTQALRNIALDWRYLHPGLPTLQE
jgi:hypothetical protein